MGHLVNDHGHPVHGLGEPITVGIAATAGSAAAWALDNYGDAAVDKLNEWGDDALGWAKDGLSSGWDSVQDWLGFGSSPNRFKCRPPKGKRKYWVCYAPATPDTTNPFGMRIKGNPEEVISCPQGFVPEKTRILHSTPKKRITNNYDLSIGGRMCIKVGMPNEAGMGPCNYDTFDSSGKKNVHRGNERTSIFESSPKRRIVKKSKGGRACVKVVKPTPGIIPDFPHMKSRERRQFEAELAAEQRGKAPVRRSTHATTVPTAPSKAAAPAPAPAAQTNWLLWGGAAAVVLFLVMKKK